MVHKKKTQQIKIIMLLICMLMSAYAVYTSYHHTIYIIEKGVTIQTNYNNYNLNQQENKLTESYLSRYELLEYNRCIVTLIFSLFSFLTATMFYFIELNKTGFSLIEVIKNVTK